VWGPILTPEWRLRADTRRRAHPAGWADVAGDDGRRWDTPRWVLAGAASVAVHRLAGHGPTSVGTGPPAHAVSGQELQRSGQGAAARPRGRAHPRVGACSRMSACLRAGLHSTGRGASLRARDPVQADEGGPRASRTVTGAEVGFGRSPSGRSRLPPSRRWTPSAGPSGLRSALIELRLAGCSAHGTSGCQPLQLGAPASGGVDHRGSVRWSTL